MQSMDERLLDFARGLGITEPTLIQTKAWPVVVRRKNCLISAPTGSGKTEAAVFPVLMVLAAEPAARRGVRALYITPLRSLNRDMMTRMERYAVKAGLSVDVRHGDTSAYARRKTLLKPPDLLITTPETLGILLSSKQFKANLVAVEWVVVDEVHELVGSKRGAQLAINLARLRDIAVGKITQIGLSATVGDAAVASRFLFNRSPSAIIVDSRAREYSVDVRLVEEDMEAIAACIEDDILKNDYVSVLVFMNTRDGTEILGAMLKMRRKVRVEVHHGSLSKESREEVENGLRRGSFRAVVCTSSLELGIDIGKIDHVFQIDSPRQVGKLVQRVGRSFHTAGRPARGTILCRSEDEYLESVALLNTMRRKRGDDMEEPYGPLDVLAVAIVGMSIGKGGVARQEVYRLLQGIAQYSMVGEAVLDECVSLLQQSGLVILSNGVIRPRAKAYEFFFSNLSMIPNVESYEVKELASSKRIGRLDERFVAESLEEGQRVILKGEPWEIVSINDFEAKVYVEKAGSLTGATPVWTGEMIPVEQETAKEVGLIRGGSPGSVGTYVSETKRILDVVPSADKIVVESGKAGVVIHACFGTKINNALQLALGGILRSISGFAPKMVSDPYRVFVSGPFPFERLRDSLLNVDIEKLVIPEIASTRAFNYAIWQIAKRFGVVAAKAKYDRRVAESLTTRYSDTIIFVEALKEAQRKKYDAMGLKRVVSEIREGRVKLLFKRVDGYSPMAGALVYDRGVEEADVRDGDIKSLKDTMLRRHARLVCLSCGGWERVCRVSEAPAEPRCPVCKSRLVGITSPYDADAVKVVQRKVRKKPLTMADEGRFRRLWKSSSLYVSFGGNAVVAMACYGVGEDTAARVLRQAVGERDLYVRLYAAQRNFVLNRKYWKD